MQKRERITKTVEYLMLGTALFFDLLSIIPIVNIVSWILDKLTFGMWFLIRGAGFVGFFNSKKPASETLMYIAGFIPVLSILPEVTVRVFRSIKMIQSEDKEYNLKRAENARKREQLRNETSYTPQRNAA